MRRIVPLSAIISYCKESLDFDGFSYGFILNIFEFSRHLNYSQAASREMKRKK